MKKWLLILGLLPIGGWADPYTPQTQQAEVPKPVELPSIAVPESVPTTMGLKEAVDTAFRYQSSLRASESQIPGPSSPTGFRLKSAPAHSKHLQRAVDQQSGGRIGRRFFGQRLEP